MAFIPKNVIDKAEDISELVVKKSKAYFLMVSRLCLISTFLEDSLRLYFQWSEHSTHMDKSWNCGMFLATMFVVINFAGQLIGCILILLQKSVRVACGILFFIVILQVVAYGNNFLSNFQFLLRISALIGSLLLLLADSDIELKPLLAGIPSTGENKRKNYLQLTGRCLIIFMFIALLKFQLSFFQLIQDIIETIMMVLVFIGYKTKLSAFVLVLILTILNFYYNNWWTITESVFLRDFVKYHFFQTLSVIGGLLLIVLRGPGKVSIDERKNK